MFVLHPMQNIRCVVHIQWHSVSPRPWVTRNSEVPCSIAHVVVFLHSHGVTLWMAHLCVVLHNRCQGWEVWLVCQCLQYVFSFSFVISCVLFLFLVCSSFSKSNRVLSFLSAFFFLLFSLLDDTSMETHPYCGIHDVHCFLFLIDTSGDRFIFWWNDDPWYRGRFVVRSNSYNSLSDVA